MIYDLELNKLPEIIKGKKKVLIQLPDGLKPQAEQIVTFLEKKTESEIFVWSGSCFGACDIPNVRGFDLIIQFGHSRLR